MIESRGGGALAPVRMRAGRLEIDGRPALLLSGEIHYFRLRRDEWDDRLRLAREAGLDTVASYVPWLWHELADGSLDLTGRTAPERDLRAFIALCQEHGLRFIARPGPFVMAELKNEGIPYAIRRRHPALHPVGWDGRPADSRDLDYGAPEFRAEAGRWLDAVLPLLASAQTGRGGPVSAVQLDNEIGMLAWVTNTPQLTDHAVAALWDRLTARHGEPAAARILGVGPDPAPADVTAAARSGGADSLAFHQELGLFFRTRFSGYVDWLVEQARRHGLDVPLLINVHGTGGGRGRTFPIGVSQLAQSYRGRPGLTAGSDYYFGELTVGNVSDLYLCNAILGSVLGPEQAATSLEFEAGTSDYGEALDTLNSPAAAVLKTLITLGQGNRLINYYTFAGGRNPALVEPGQADGIDRLAFTGERHGFGAPIDPEGRVGATYPALRELITELEPHRPVLAAGRQVYDDLGYGFVADHYLTEYAHPRSTERAEQVADHERYRGFGFRDALGRALVLGGFSFPAVDLQALADPDGDWAAGASGPADRLSGRVIAFATGRTLAAPVQRLLADHVRTGGRLFLTGRLPDRNHDGSACTVLADALGLADAGLRTDRVDADSCYWPTIGGVGELDDLPDVRVGSAQLLEVGDAATAESLLVERGSGRPVAVRVRVGAGSAIMLGCDYPAAHLATWRRLLALLDLTPRIGCDAERPGLVALPVRADDSGVMIVINVAPYPIQASITLDGHPVAARRTYPPLGHALVPLTSEACTGVASESS